MAGRLGVLLHDRFRVLGWLCPFSKGKATAYDVTVDGAKGFQTLGIDVNAIRMLRRRLACPCLDWSERRPHLGGSLGAALLKIALKKKWVLQDLDSRALGITSIGRRELFGFLGVQNLITTEEYAESGRSDCEGDSWQQTPNACDSSSGSSDSA